MMGLEFYSGIGCYENEQKVGNKFIADIELYIDCSLAAEKDNISYALNYVEIYNLVKDEFRQNCYLIENIAYRVKNRILNFSEDILEVTVRISKVNPPIGGKIEKVSITTSGKK